MTRIPFFAYGLLAYLLFLAAFLYAIGFVENMLVPKGIDAGVIGPRSTAIIIDVALLGLFAVQHSIMARPQFKKRWTTLVPHPIERSTYVLLASLILLLLYWQWRPMPSFVAHAHAAWLRTLLFGVSFLGWAQVLIATFIIDHFDLFGLRQVWLHLQGRPYTHHAFAERSLYKIVRHPLMLGFIIAFWFTPDMTQGHLLFAGVTTAYILVAIQLEERDLMTFLGEDYRRYRTRTPMILPLPKQGDGPEATSGT
jgi:protein-S-isoprenylcysteine O-methyltransferase Ste14